MKKYLAIALAAAMICSFAGCNNNEPTGGSAETTTAETTTEATTVEETTTAETATVAETEETTTVADTTAEETTAPETTTAVTTTVPETTVPETTTAAPETTTEAAKPTNAYAKAIESARDEQMNKVIPVMTTPDNAFILEMFGVKAEQMDEFAIAASMMNIKAYGIAVIKPAKGCEQAVLDGVKGFVEMQQRNFEFYLVDQKEIADNAIVETTKDGLVILVMCEDAETVYKTIMDNLK